MPQTLTGGDTEGIGFATANAAEPGTPHLVCAVPAIYMSTLRARPRCLVCTAEAVIARLMANSRQGGRLCDVGSCPCE
jgi:hypothetical protein